MTKDTNELFGLMEIFYILIVVVVIQPYISPNSQNSIFQEGDVTILNYISINFYTQGIYQWDPWQRWVWKDGLVFQFLSH